jgi:nitrogen regulatory protein PII
MNAIVAFIKPHKLADVTMALRKLEGLSGMTVTDVRGFGRTRGEGSPDVVPDDVADFVRKSRIEVFCSDDLTPVVVRAIKENAHTGAHGDGKVYVMNCLTALRISTGETGEEAV